MERDLFRILVVSDTHGRGDGLKEAIRLARPFDHLIHCGDTEGREREIATEAGCPCTIVRGNNDYFSTLPEDAVVELSGYRIFVTHGHQYGVSMTTEYLREEAKAERCRIACFGHTHRPYLDQSDPELTVLNPGSLSFPRQEGREPTYLVIEVDRRGRLHFLQNHIGRRRL
jgi:hypothetical protein